MSNHLLQGLLEDALALKDEIKSAHSTHILTEDQSQRCFSGIAVIIQVIKGGTLQQAVDLVTTTPARKDSITSELPDFKQWPSRREACPKCRNIKPGFIKYYRASRVGPERVEHGCLCGYVVMTKPVDQSKESDDPFLRVDEPLPDNKWFPSVRP